MDAENLKQIVDLLKGLGGNATTAFVWYLIIPALRDLLLGGIIVGGICTCLHKIYRIVDRTYEKPKS
jgi:hypothetical protein